MDELRGPTIQIVLHVKEGLGFGFLRTPFIVGGSLNGYTLETDPAVPCHAPFFDAELVWEADKRRFRNLRVQNVPVKVEVYTTGTQGKKDKVGYMLLSLLGAQPCPSKKVVDVRYSWHKLLGVKSEGKCCHPQLLLSLSVEDRNSTPTPRNELAMFHSNEVAYPTVAYPMHCPPVKTMHMTVNELFAESEKTVTSAELQPRLLRDEGLIQIGDGHRLFVLSFVIGVAENVDLLLPDLDPAVPKESHNCYLTYTVFTHNIMTDRVGVTVEGGARSVAAFNQRSSLRLRTELPLLSRYFAERPLVVVRLCAGEKDVGICSMDLRKLVPTPALKHFLQSFCNANDALTIHERCHLLCVDEKARGTRDESRRPFVDLEMSLRYVEKAPDPRSQLTARSATQLESARLVPDSAVLGDCKSGSCTNFDAELGTGYTKRSASNTNRDRNAAGDGQTTDIAALIRQMCESFATSQEKLLTTRLRPSTSDMQVQCEMEPSAEPGEALDSAQTCKDDKLSMKGDVSKSDTYVLQNKQDTGQIDKEAVKRVMSAAERDEIMKVFVEELEDWKEKQQELYKCQLERKEQYHLELLAKEWAKKRVELECKLAKGIEQCRNLSADLSRATEEFRLKGYRSNEREKKVLEAKKALEQHYRAKFQELREASQMMEEDKHYQLRIKDTRIDELELKLAQMEKQLDVMKNNLKNSEKENEIKYSGLTKDQTASLIQELRCLEEKLDSAEQSKAFFKEQWGRAVRELHFTKLTHRRQLLTQLRQDRRQLADMGLDPQLDEEGTGQTGDSLDINKLKDDYYMDILANTPGLDAHSVISTTIVPEEMEMYNGEIKGLPRNPLNEKLNELIAQRDQLIQEENPDEPTLKRLNHEIRNLLLNFGT